MDDEVGGNKTEKPSTRASNPFGRVPVEVRVSVGRARPSIRDLLHLRRDAVLALALDRRVEDPVELFVGDRLIARGELEELDGEQAGMLSVRLTEVAEANEDL